MPSNGQGRLRPRLIEGDGQTIPAYRTALTVGNIGKRYRETVLPRKRAGKNQAIILDAFLRSTIATTRLSSVKPAHFARYRDERLETVKPATINRELGLVQRMFEVARKECGIPLASNPVRDIEKPPADPARTRRQRDGEWETPLVHHEMFSHDQPSRAAAVVDR